MNCGASYHVTSRPKVDWTCDVCGGEVVQRDDDTEAAVTNRLEVYERQTVPIIDFYCNLGKLVEVDGVGEGNEVQERLIKEIDGRFAARSKLITRKNAEQLALMRRAGEVVAEMHEVCIRAAVPGATTARRRRAAREVLGHAGRSSNFLGYHGFPAVVCTSPNDVIVHGIPSADVVLQEGDILSIDCGAIIEGWHGDAAVTVPIGEVDDESTRLIEVTRRSLEAAIEQVVEGHRLGDVGAAVEGIAEQAGFSVVREYVGHGIGTAMHEDPQRAQLRAGGSGHEAQGGARARHRADGERGHRRDRGARRRLDRRHPRRPPLRPLRAHHRRHRARPRGAHPPGRLSLRERNVRLLRRGPASYSMVGRP